MVHTYPQSNTALHLCTTCTQDSVTALHLAAYGGSLECVEYLMTLFRDRKFEMDENGRTCLHYAVWGGSLKVMRYLVDWCRLDLGLRTAVSCAYLVLYMFRQDRYNDKTQCTYVCTHTHTPHMHTQYMRHHYAPI